MTPIIVLAMACLLHLLAAAPDNSLYVTHHGGIRGDPTKPEI
jgi:hypothetical protein